MAESKTPLKNIWRIVEHAPQRFEECALELFAFQARECKPYREYLNLIGCDTSRVKSVEEIPFLPIELFKSQQVYCIDTPPEAVFTSSSTTGSTPSRHAMASLLHYEQVSVEGFERMFGELSDYTIYALLPSYMERDGSSLIYMVERFVERARGGGLFLRNHDELLAKIANDCGKKLLLGVSYALLDLAERGDVALEDTVVMETGGMKGQRAELSKRELHNRLSSAFGVDAIASEYGMAELTSQAYSYSDGVFTPPPWMRVVLRDINDPFCIVDGEGARGGVNIIDLASWHSCAFIQCQDIAKLRGGGFSLEGRVNRSEIRGCNLLVENS